MPRHRPETRRKVPKYFGDNPTLEMAWREGWEVGFYCPLLRRWDWEHLATERISKKLEAEAKAAAVKLLRASASRQEEAAAKIHNGAVRLRRQADAIADGRADWSAL